MKPDDLPQPTTAERINAAFAAILAGRFNAPEVLDVLWGRVASPELRTQLTEERGWRMQIETTSTNSLQKSREEFARLRNDLNRQFDELLARVDAARRVA